MCCWDDEYRYVKARGRLLAIKDVGFRSSGSHGIRKSKKVKKNHVTKILIKFFFILFFWLQNIAIDTIKIICYKSNHLEIFHLEISHLEILLNTIVNVRGQILRDFIQACQGIQMKHSRITFVRNIEWTASQSNHSYVLKEGLLRNKQFTNYGLH